MVEVINNLEGTKVDYFIYTLPNTCVSRNLTMHEYLASYYLRRMTI